MDRVETIFSMSMQEIKESINKWKDIMDNSEALNEYFEQGSCFLYDFPKYAEDSEYIHAYPGIHGDFLIFMFIPSKFDKAETKDIQNYVKASRALQGQNTGRITKEEAMSRIADWVNHHKKWVKGQVCRPEGMFQAFQIDREDYELANTENYLGLKRHTEGHKTVDLIVANLDGKQEAQYFDDFSDPVPPFGVNAPQSSFYLLTL